MAAAADNFSRSTLPSINRAADETGRAVRQMGLAASAVSDKPATLHLRQRPPPRQPRRAGFAPPWPTPDRSKARAMHTLPHVLPLRCY